MPARRPSIRDDNLNYESFKALAECKGKNAGLERALPKGDLLC